MTASSIQPQQTLQSNPVQGVWSDPIYSTA